MAKRVTGRAKLTPDMRARVAEKAAELRKLLYGEAGCPAWGTSFCEIEGDAKELGHELIRVLMEQTGREQSQLAVPEEALATDSGEKAELVGTRTRTLETESGPVIWQEPEAYLPQSRKAFFPSEPGPGAGGP